MLNQYLWVLAFDDVALVVFDVSLVMFGEKIHLRRPRLDIITNAISRIRPELCRWAPDHFLGISDMH